MHEAVQEEWRLRRWKVLWLGRREVRDELLRHEVRAPRTRQLTEPRIAKPGNADSSFVRARQKRPGQNDRGILLQKILLVTTPYTEAPYRTGREDWMWVRVMRSCQQSES